MNKAFLSQILVRVLLEMKQNFLEEEQELLRQDIRLLGLPPGCVIIRCVMDGHSFVPTADTKLEPHMKITVVVSPEAVQGLSTLRHGCRTRKPGNKSAYAAE